MKKIKFLFILFPFATILFSSCTALDEDLELQENTILENLDTQAAEKTMRRGGIDD